MGIVMDTGIRTGIRLGLVLGWDRYQDRDQHWAGTGPGVGVNFLGGSTGMGTGPG